MIFFHTILLIIARSAIISLIPNSSKFPYRNRVYSFSRIFFFLIYYKHLHITYYYCLSIWWIAKLFVSSNFHSVLFLLIDVMRVGGERVKKKLFSRANILDPCYFIFWYNHRLILMICWLYNRKKIKNLLFIHKMNKLSCFKKKKVEGINKFNR